MSNAGPDVHDEYVASLVARFATLEFRQGSEAFDTFVSASQYLPAYRWITQNVPAGSRILDWGCGTGHFSDFLQRNGYDVIPYGFDPPDFLIHVRSPAAARFVQATTNILMPFEAGTFDVVTSIGVLEHVREFHGTELDSLKEIARVLRPGGRFFCFHLPNRYSWIELVSSLIGKWHHRYRFTRPDIECLCTAARMEVTECTRYGFLPRNILGHEPLNRFVRATGSRNIFEAADDLLEKLFASVAQNWMFCANKRPHE
jgi:SAM-dependent methyltransferase